MRKTLGSMFAVALCLGCGGLGGAPPARERVPECAGVECSQCAPVAARVVVRDAFTGGPVSGVSVEGLEMT